VIDVIFYRSPLSLIWTHFVASFLTPHMGKVSLASLPLDILPPLGFPQKKKEGKVNNDSLSLPLVATVRER
jgi:hypothetical protein